MRWSWGVAALFAAACASSGGSPSGKPDLSAAPTDGSASVDDGGTRTDLRPRGDLARVYQAATIHDIDTGVVTDGTAVALTRVVLNTPVASRLGAGGCTYRAWVQDPAGAAPAGLDVYVFVAGASSCSSTPPAPLAGRAQGDTVDVKGVVSVNSYPTDGGGMLVQHSVYADDIVVNSNSSTVTAVALADPTRFTGYASGFQQYEGMLIELTCGNAVAACVTDGGKLKVKYQAAPYLWGVTGFALFGSAFAAEWPGKPGPNGTAYTKLVGVANTFLTGSLEPRAPGDFVP